MDVLGSRKPDFDQLLAVLKCEKPSRPVLFELFMNDAYYRRMSDYVPADRSAAEHVRMVIDAFARGGYDYATVHANSMNFPVKEQPHMLKTKSLNDAGTITDWASFEAYVWPDAKSMDYSALAEAEKYLPANMKLMVMGPGGVLENIIKLTGYDNLCFMLFDDPELVKAIADRVGQCLADYYTAAAEYKSVGVLMSNDDWGFNTQTFLSVSDMRRYIFPWHKKIVQIAHAAGKPALLHSCGHPGQIMEDVIEDMGFDGRHSYEDNIIPVEDFYQKYHGRIAVLGGLDMNFLVTQPVDAVRARARRLLEMSQQYGGYALGTGNSVPEYIPYDAYMAIIETALSYDAGQ